MYGLKKRVFQAAETATPVKTQRKKSVFIRGLDEQILAHLVQHPNKTTPQLLKKFNIANSTLHNSLHRLVSDGRVTKVPYNGRRMKYSATPGATTKELIDELETRAERILQYVNDHIDVQYTNNQMADELGISRGSITYEVNKLLKRGLIPTDHRNGATQEEPTTPEPTKETLTPAKTATNEATLNDIVETLIWEYIKATRNTDLLLFLSWLDNKK